MNTLDILFGEMQNDLNNENGCFDELAVKFFKTLANNVVEIDRGVILEIAKGIVGKIK